MSNALARRIGTWKYRRHMSAFQFVSLLPTYHLVNGQTSDQANWAHGRRPEASSSRVLKTLQDSGKRGYRRSRGIPAQPASCSKRPCHTRPPRMRQDARHSRTKGAANFLSVPSVAHVSRFTGFKRDARTPPRERRVSARRGRAGEKSDFFSILLWSSGAVQPVRQRSDPAPGPYQQFWPASGQRRARCRLFVRSSRIRSASYRW